MKSFDVIFSNVALDDVDQIFDYYEKLQPDLGKRFARELQAGLNAIYRNPFFASIRYDNIRCVAIKKFPYLIHYHVDEKELLVTIIAVYSTYKEPFW